MFGVAVGQPPFLFVVLEAYAQLDLDVFVDLLAFSAVFESDIVFRGDGEIERNSRVALLPLLEMGSVGFCRKRDDPFRALGLGHPMKRSGLHPVRS